MKFQVYIEVLVITTVYLEKRIENQPGSNIDSFNKSNAVVFGFVDHISHIFLVFGRTILL